MTLKYQSPVENIPELRSYPRVTAIAVPRPRTRTCWRRRSKLSTIWKICLANPMQKGCVEKLQAISAPPSPRPGGKHDSHEQQQSHSHHPSLTSAEGLGTATGKRGP